MQNALCIITKHLRTVALRSHSRRTAHHHPLLLFILVTLLRKAFKRPACRRRLEKSRGMKTKNIDDMEKKKPYKNVFKGFNWFFKLRPNVFGGVNSIVPKDVTKKNRKMPVSSSLTFCKKNEEKANL